MDMERTAIKSTGVPARPTRGRPTSSRTPRHSQKTRPFAFENATGGSGLFISRTDESSKCTCVLRHLSTLHVTGLVLVLPMLPGIPLSPRTKPSV